MGIVAFSVTRYRPQSSADEAEKRAGNLSLELKQLLVRMTSARYIWYRSGVLMLLAAIEIFSRRRGDAKGARA